MKAAAGVFSLSDRLVRRRGRQAALPLLGVRRGFLNVRFPNTPSNAAIHTFINRRRANRRTPFNRVCRAARRPAFRAGRHKAAASPPPAAFGKAECGAPRKCAVCTARADGGVSESAREQGKLKAAAGVFSLSDRLVRRRGRQAALPLLGVRRGFLNVRFPNTPSNAAIHTFINRRRANRRTPFNRVCRAARRPAFRAGRHKAAASPPPAAFGKAECGAPRKCAVCAARADSGVSESAREQGKLKAAAGAKLPNVAAFAMSVQ